MHHLPCLQELQKLSPAVLRILAKRGHEDQESMADFFSWELKKMANFSQLLDLEKAAQKIIDTIMAGKKIAIYGDYDVDGCTSCALLYHAFRLLGYNVTTYQPSRFIEGYGLHESSIEDALNDGVELLITVDCGITSYKACDVAGERGLDVIITDHHQDGDENRVSAYAVVNPNRRDERACSELKDLAGVGVAFALALEVRKLWERTHCVTAPSFYELLPLVALGTICDMASLTPTNLKLVRHGLKLWPASQYAGLKVFLTPEEKQFTFLPSEKLSFFIGPMINAKGRMDHPELALRLLKEVDDMRACEEIFYQLKDSNQSRKYFQNKVYTEAKLQIEKNFLGTLPSVLVVYRPDWHEGVVGIVASKLVEAFKVAAIVLTDVEGKPELIKGSARSAGEVNLYESLSLCSDLFVKFGGHHAAAGLTMERKNLAQFQARLEAQISSLPYLLRTVQTEIDTEISASEISISFLKSLDFLEPFGMNNPRPVFLIKDLKLESFDILKDVHVKWTFSATMGPQNRLQNLRGISFYYTDRWDALSPQEIIKRQQEAHGDVRGSLTVLASLGINHFKGNEYIQLQVLEIQI